MGTNIKQNTPNIIVFIIKLHELFDFQVIYYIREIIIGKVYANKRKSTNGTLVEQLNHSIKEKSHTVLSKLSFKHFKLFCY